MQSSSVALSAKNSVNSELHLRSDIFYFVLEISYIFWNPYYCIQKTINTSLSQQKGGGLLVFWGVLLGLLFCISVNFTQFISYITTYYVTWFQIFSSWFH